MSLQWIAGDELDGLSYWWDGGRQVLVKLDGHLSFGSFLPCDGTREGAERAVERAIASTPPLTNWERGYL